jgi:hypothetical protein
MKAMTYDYFNHIQPHIVESINGQSGAVTIRGSNSIELEKTPDGYFEMKGHPSFAGAHG